MITVKIQENMVQMNLSMKQKQSPRHREQTHGCQGGCDQGRGRLGGWGEQMQTITQRRDKQQDPTVQTGNSIQYHGITIMEKNIKKSVQRNSLLVQRLGLHTFTARAQMQPLVRKLRSCKLFGQGKKKYMCVHLSHCVVQKKLVQHRKSTVFQ